MEKNINRAKKDKENPYTKVSNAFINDSRLSFKAKGILLYLLSKPDTWVYKVQDLYNYSTDGFDSIKNGIKELKACGYIHTISEYDLNRGDFVRRRNIVEETPLFSKKFRSLDNINKNFRKDEILLINNPLLKNKRQFGAPNKK